MLLFSRDLRRSGATGTRAKRLGGNGGEEDWKLMAIRKIGNPKLEDGYTRIANELLEAIYKRKFTGQEMSIIGAIMRFSYGFNRKYAPLSLRDFENETGIKRKHVYEIVAELRKNGVVKRTVEGLGIRKDYRSWGVPLWGDKVSRRQGTLCPAVGGQHIYMNARDKDNSKENIKDKQQNCFINKKLKGLTGMFSLKDLLNKNYVK